MKKLEWSIFRQNFFDNRFLKLRIKKIARRYTITLVLLGVLHQSELDGLALSLLH